MKKAISTPNAPAAIGPYSQAIEVNGMIYTSGVIPVNPATGEIPATVEEQAEQAFSNMAALLKDAGSSMENVVKTTVFLSDIADFAAMNEVYKQYYQSECPARSAFAVKSLPMGALVEIETIAGK